jgi:hypothetical protein
MGWLSRSEKAIGGCTIGRVRARRRFRYVLPVLAIPACAAAVGVAVQAAAFGRAPERSLIVTQSLRELVRYHVMRGTESVAGRPLGSACVQGWFKLGSRRGLTRGAIVLLSDGERLYDMGHGVRRLPRSGPSRPADLEDRVRFLLAACPRVVTDRLATDLIRGNKIELSNRRADGTEAAAIVVGSHRARLTLDVSALTYKPVAISVAYRRFSGSSDLVPGGGGVEIRRVRRAFHLPLAHTRA